MSERTETMSNLLMLSAVAATCADCGDQRLFVPIDADASMGSSGEYCCTSCDAAVFLLEVADPARRQSTGRVA